MFLASILDLVLKGFLISFLVPKCVAKAIYWVQRKVNKTLRGRTFFWCWFLRQATKVMPKLLKNCMFFEASILHGFWECFGRVLGGQNPWFSHIFWCFFVSKFGVQLGRPKFRKQLQKRGGGDDHPLGFAVRAGLGGRIIGWGESLPRPEFQALPQDRPWRLGFLG